MAVFENKRLCLVDALRSTKHACAQNARASDIAL
ncbi:hypothetical protein LMG33818_001359 [Halomonadaceae bacterium LMG 33818]